LTGDDGLSTTELGDNHSRDNKTQNKVGDKRDKKADYTHKLN